MYPDNNWYAHRETLAEYWGVKDAHAFASIQHGIVKLKYFLQKYLH